MCQQIRYPIVIELQLIDWIPDLEVRSINQLAPCLQPLGLRSAYNTLIRKSIRGHVQFASCLHRVFLQVLSQLYFTFTTPNKDQQERTALLLSIGSRDSELSLSRAVAVLGQGFFMRREKRVAKKLA